ncbi:hypothetical protein E7T09_02230 [Deinococcus sp. KSM4-11]|uniref:hypothetical protein n=1 Tax=Deinococcus sp. KSM4-11 TaxID=2568654 RepID=UPI0010A55D3B|nr:hypothetical protein [Deinococcus sp. KSM4-11]THF88058.1 hypothetical protein E7T09_02230 [Deinococcus sp. KSM4-11]
MADGIVVAQLIEVTWDKAQRHALRATRRNQLPDSLPLLSFQRETEAEIVVHSVHIDRNGTGTETMSQYHRPGLANLQHVELNVEDNVLHVLCRPDLKWTEIPRPQLTIATGQWGRVIVEEGGATAGYRKITHNIGYFEVIDPLVFATQPSVREWRDSHRLMR